MPGAAKEASIASNAIVTSNSIRVKPLCLITFSSKWPAYIECPP